ncbi:hypothetical protein J0676_05495 [Vibrio sp. Vb2880]|nr:MULTISPECIES: hypothetical protein [Vibrio]ADT88805.1 hypothetical protein vfu_B00578 [Vibrio furnissii NCTC 11218]EEX39886.1 hypothetical protein VFA_002420 [Vibrio furnissii CIP 102972]MBO0212932.1 hypothetical protein [Vibrio sp. Vb2880]MCG6211007.1 hypothetical protein [Vibrio furnissii]MCG6215759.1 hypothetical protein [Vibrio furnissii]
MTSNIDYVFVPKGLEQEAGKEKKPLSEQEAKRLAMVQKAQQQGGL